jgi:hypothetical protein
MLCRWCCFCKHVATKRDPSSCGAADAAQPPPPKWYDAVELHGLVDTCFSASLDQAQGTANALRVFDLTNGFQLSYAKLTAQLTPPKAYSAGFRADVGFCQTASVLMFKSTDTRAGPRRRWASGSRTIAGGMIAHEVAQASSRAG